MARDLEIRFTLDEEGLERDKAEGVAALKAAKEAGASRDEMLAIFNATIKKFSSRIKLTQSPSFSLKIEDLANPDGTVPIGPGPILPPLRKPPEVMGSVLEGAELLPTC